MTLNDLNTTSYRITLSVTTACVVIMTLLVAMLFFGWGPNDSQKWVLIGIAGGLLTMMGYDVAQFIGKRWSNIDFATAKNPATKVNVEAPSTVSVDATGVSTAPTEATTTDEDGRERVPGVGD